jgi:hypothetical protein
MLQALPSRVDLAIRLRIDMPVASEHEIKSEKILVKDIFSTMWFRIPEYPPTPPAKWESTGSS